jgi:predicted secreted protein
LSRGREYTAFVVLVVSVRWRVSGEYVWMTIGMAPEAPADPATGKRCLAAKILAGLALLLLLQAEAPAAEAPEAKAKG